MPVMLEIAVALPVLKAVMNAGISMGARPASVKADGTRAGIVFDRRFARTVWNTLSMSAELSTCQKTHADPILEIADRIELARPSAAPISR